MGIIMTTKTLRERDGRDFYPTPYGLAYAMVNEITKDYYPTADLRILDPGSGTGVFGRACRKIFPESFIQGIDKFHHVGTEYYNSWWVGDFLSTPMPGPYDLIIGNPPYNKAEEFIRKSHDYLDRHNGTIIFFLLRLGILAGQSRHNGLWKECKPSRVYPLGMRPSFTGDGKTDANDYVLLRWDYPDRGDETIIEFGFEYNREPQQMTFV